MFTTRPAGWIAAVGAIGVAFAVLLFARPATAGLLAMIFIMAGLPALYRLRRQARDSWEVAADRQRAGHAIGPSDPSASSGAADPTKAGPAPTARTPLTDQEENHAALDRS